MADNEQTMNLDLDLFVGSKSSYQKLAEKNHQAMDEDVEESTANQKSLDKKNPNRVVLSKDTLKQIDEETMTILRRTRCVHECNDVWMQSSLEFYDEYYNDVEASPELKAARQIRRVYRRYPDYLEAMRIRVEYIDSLIEKYGEDNFIQRLQMGMIKDWIPPVPIMSKKSDDYEMFVSGIVPTETETLPEGTTKEVLEALSEEVDDVELVKTCDVETSIAMVKFIEEQLEEEMSARGYRYADNGIRNLTELNNVFRSWYRQDKSTGHELFRNAPENIRKRFFEQCAFSEPGLLNHIMNGGEIEEPLPDMNEMVTDAVTGRPMTRLELERRKTIRFLTQSGWSESRLINYQKVGSEMERLAMRKKKPRKKRRKNDELNDIAGMYGDFMNEPTGVDPMYSENEYLMQALSSLMRGDT